MQRIDHILEKWAEIYKPISHIPGADSKQQAFYRIDSINEQNGFMRNYNVAHSPCMAYSTMVDAQLFAKNEKVIDYRHVVYMMIKQRSDNVRRTVVNDDNEACEIKFELDDMAQDLVSFLFELKKACNLGLSVLKLGNKEFKITSEIMLAMSGFVIDTVEWSTVPMKYNGWWIVGVQFSRKESRKLCLNGEKYT